MNHIPDNFRALLDQYREHFNAQTKIEPVLDRETEEDGFEPDVAYASYTWKNKSGQIFLTFYYNAKHEIPGTFSLDVERHDERKVRLRITHVVELTEQHLKSALWHFNHLDKPALN